MYHKNTHFHFIGIGGIGMSALAIILKQRGFIVSGSDCNLEQKSIRQLHSLGCTIFSEHDHEQIPYESLDVIVYTAAVSSEHPELKAARTYAIPVITRAQLLTELLNKQEGIAIAGAHGKTTTSSLITHILVDAGMDPTYAIGGHLTNYETNAHAGSGAYFVAEACENDRTITIIKPSIAIITNIDREHLDVYNDLDEIKEAFRQYSNNVPFYGKIIACYDDAHTMSLINTLPPEKRKQITTYGFSSDADLYVSAYELSPNSSYATVATKKTGVIGSYTLTIPGKHNLLNSLAALATAQEIDISFTAFAHACETFKGIDRRFTFKGIYKQAHMFDDYGHHPAEIEQIVPVAYRKAQDLGGKLIIAFQPHRFSRTEKLWDEFLRVLSSMPFDTLMITDIYPAFEAPRDSITSERLVRELRRLIPAKNVIYIAEDKTFGAVQTALDSIIQPHDLILFLGAGKINSLADKLAL